MGKNKTSEVWFVDSEKFQSFLDSSSSIVEVIEKIGLDPYNGNHKTINQRIKEENFDLTKLNENRTIKNKNFKVKNRVPLSSALTTNSIYNRKTLKKRLVEEGLFDYKCSSCGLTDEWNNKPISLQLDHINGINNDNTITNLRFLCPNCHSQTDTYCGKHRKKIYNCLDCGVQISKKSNKCNKCASISNGKSQRKFNVSKEELEALVNQHSMVAVGKLFNVSCNAIRKRCKLLEIDYKASNQI